MENREAFYNLDKTIKPIQRISMLFLACQIVRFIGISYISPMVGSILLLISMPSLIINPVLIYFMYRGKKWPVYLCFTGSFFLFILISLFTSLWDINNTISALIIFSWVMFIMEVTLIGYLLFHPACKKFYEEMKRINR